MSQKLCQLLLRKDSDGKTGFGATETVKCVSVYVCVCWNTILLFKKDEKEILQARMTRMINGLEGMTYCMKRD